MSDTTEQIPPEASQATMAQDQAETRGPLPPDWEVDAIIRKRVYGALGLGLIPIPLVDLAGLYALQVELVYALAKKYDVPFKPDRVKTLVVSLVGSVLPVSLAPAVASLCKLIPIVGWTTGAISLSAVGGACTYAVGRVFAQHFALGGSLLNLDKEKLQKPFARAFEEGKAFVGNLGKKDEAAPAADMP